MLARPFDEVWKDHRDKVRRLVDHLAGRSPASSCLRDDMLAAAMVGLWEASLRFDLSRARPLWTFAFLRVKGCALDVLRDYDSLTRYGRKMTKAGASFAPWSLRESVGLDDLVRSPSSELDPEAEAAAREEAALLLRASAELPGRLRLAVEGVLAGERLRPIAARLGVSEVRVSQLVSEGAATLRAKLGVGAQEVAARRVESSRSRRRAFAEVEHEGRTMRLAEWAREKGLGASTLRERLRAGWSVGRALTEAARRGRRPRSWAVV